jgi:hypothetical protein
MVEINDHLGLSEAMNYMYLNYEKFESELIINEVSKKFGQKAFFSNVIEMYEKAISNFKLKRLK